ncbi:uncharacterized protein LOC144606423 [Rhinoraja longicauda]
MSSLSYRKRGNMKDSLGGKSNNDSLLSTLSKERSMSPERSFRKAKKTTSADNLTDTTSSRKKFQTADDMDDGGSVISQAYSEATSRARKGLDRRWALTSPDFDKASTVSVPISRASARRALEAEDDAKSSVSFALTSPTAGLRRSLSRLDDNRGDVFSPTSPLLSRRSELGLQSPTLSRTDTRLSIARSRLGELEDDDPAVSVALSERPFYSQHSGGRSFSVPPRPRSSVSDETPPEGSDIKPVSHRTYLDPALEAAIKEVLDYKPITFKRKSLEPDEDEEEMSMQLSSLRRSSSSVDVSKKHKSKKRRSSDSESSTSEEDRRRKGSKKRSKKSKKKSKKKESDSESSESSSSSSSGSTVSYRSISSIKRGTTKREPHSPDDEGKEDKANGNSGKKMKKTDKKRMKQVDSVMMKYLYRPESDE